MLAKSQMLQAYIGTEKSEEFYEDAFAKYSITGVDQFQWHWSWWAMFGGIFYLLYRKLYWEALGYLAVFVVVTWIFPFYALIMWIVSGGVLPYFVYKRYKKILILLEKNDSSEDQQLDILFTKGGVNQWAIFLGVAFHMVMFIGMGYMVLTIQEDFSGLNPEIKSVIMFLIGLVAIVGMKG